MPILRSLADRTLTDLDEAYLTPIIGRIIEEKDQRDIADLSILVKSLCFLRLGLHSFRKFYCQISCLKSVR
jgi:hypothetical protein